MISLQKWLLPIIITFFIYTPCYAHSHWFHSILHHEAHIPQQVTTHDLKDFYRNPEAVRLLITHALSLTNQNLKYIYGSDDPARGGLDCSGTIDYLLHHSGLREVPRESDQLYRWVWEHGKFYAVNGYNMQSFEFDLLKPGDLLFWTGTYPVRRNPPVTHVMLYIGKNYQGEPLMVGATDAGTYWHRHKHGVNVQVFALSERHSSRFIGYGCIPSINCG